MGKDQSIAHVENGSVYVLQASSHDHVTTADICPMTGKPNRWIGQLTVMGEIDIYPKLNDIEEAPKFSIIFD